MKYFLVALFIVCGMSCARDSAYFLGMQNSKYAYVGMRPYDHWGVLYKNSVFVQDLEFQYGRLAVFYSFSAPFNLSGECFFFGGMRFNRDYYDVGSELDVRYALHPRYLVLRGILQPRYDSEIGRMIGYFISGRTKPLEEVGLQAGVKNLPEYRDVERRVFAGLVFESGHLKVEPEISIPFEMKLENTRVAISFIYINLF